MAEMQVDVVGVEKKIWSGEAEHYIGDSDDQEWRVARDRARARLQAAGESVEQ